MLEPLLLGVSSLLSVHLEPPFTPQEGPHCASLLGKTRAPPFTHPRHFGHKAWLSRAASVEANLGWSPAFVTSPPFCHMGVELRLSREHREASVTQVK